MNKINKNKSLQIKTGFSVPIKFNGVKRIILTIASIILLVPSVGLAYNLPDNQYPKAVNLYWKTPITMEEVPLLAKWDMLALDMKAQVDSAEAILKIRELNPDIIILAYTTANEVPRERLQIMEPGGTGLWHDLISGISPEWYLKTYQGENISYWPGNLSMNQYVSDRSGNFYNDYLINFYTNKVLSTNLWDGLLFDNIWNTAAWVNPDMDMDGDGQKDSENKINQLWQVGNRIFFKNLRDRLGDKYLILGNGEGSYSEYTNGRMFEGFPEFWEGGWVGSMERYFIVNAKGYQPRINIINADSDNTGQYTNSSRMRYGLTSTLLYDGYYSFDWGTEKREDFWWYDEFDINLGQPKSKPINLLDQKNGRIKEGVWKRDFENGLAIVNSTDKNQTINFDREYEKIKSTQNYDISNGGKIDSLTLSPEDGTILLRPIEEMKEAVFTNGSFARIFNQNGESIRSGFFAYNQKFRGGLKIAKLNIDGDDHEETIISDKSTITILSDSGFTKTQITPYGYKYNGGLSLAFADLDKDGKMEIITGPENGGANEIKVFNSAGVLINSWYAYKKTASDLGVNLAAGDINGDGEIEIIAGAGYKGGPHVKVFDKTGRTLISEFFAYNKNFRGGTYVASGDINGDGVAEIITGIGQGGEPEVKIFNSSGVLVKAWLPYDSKKKDGTRVAVTDIDSDGNKEIITLTTDVFTLSSTLDEISN
ncbi:MAG: putative glycoside hydrolase [Candidatus Buchananbacteria bacterium]|nr:putative glycoside hydrolase [Candidatus Buchananbacteria bacterium]